MNKKIFYISCVSFMLIVMVFATAVSVHKNLVLSKTYTMQINKLENKSKSNKDSIDKLTSEIQYQGSNEFIEKIARDKLGFVKKDEIVFVEKNS